MDVATAVLEVSPESVVSFRVYGDPKPQPRARAFSRGGHARVYDPATAEGWKGELAMAARERVPIRPLTGPVAVRMTFLLRRPAGHLGKRGLKPSAPRWPLNKFDCDNLAKAALDACTTLAFWEDDGQVVELWVSKGWADGGTRPGALITIAAVS